MNPSRGKPTQDDAIVRRAEPAGVTRSVNQTIATWGSSPPGRIPVDSSVAIPWAEPLLALFLNGRPDVRPFEEARSLFHRCAYSWLLPMDFYRWRVAGRTGYAFVFDRVKPAGRRFGLQLHTRGTRGLTMRALEDVEGGNAMTENVFHARAARFIKVFEELPSEFRPFRFYQREDVRGQRQPAYQMRTDREYVVVVGPADGTPIDAVDWQHFLTPPDPTEPPLLK